MNAKASIDMTHGPLLGKILLFSLPLMASNVLQILFNAADVVVVGRFAGHASLAAVGGTSCIVYLFINLLVGISVGVNVTVANYLGQTGREREISQTLHTAVAVALAGGAALGAAGIAASRAMLALVDTPSNVFALALTYIRIYFAGTPFLMLYNYGAAALRATGDTRRPLLFLLSSGILNVGLNLLFVIALDMDTAGVALATVLSEALSAALILGCLMRSPGALRLSLRKLGFHRAALVSMARIGIPAGVQSCLFSLSNVVIQGAVNSYGSVIAAGVSAGSSIENFLYVSMNAFHHACQTFISQNVGAGRYDRVGRIVRTCLLCTIALGIVLSAGAVVFSQPLLRIYNREAAVIQAGTVRLTLVGSLYVIFGVADVLVGAIRGCGFPLAPVIINLLGTCAFRLLWISRLDCPAADVRWVYASYPISWALIAAALALFWLYLRRSGRAFRPPAGAAMPHQ